MILPAFTTLGAGPTVLMLHGIGGGHLAFAPQVETLASSGYRAVAWDMPGYGHSAPIEPYTFKGLAQSCITPDREPACRRDARSVILLGHSMGGMVAQEVVARRPELVNRLDPVRHLAVVRQARRRLAARLHRPAHRARWTRARAWRELAEVLVPQMVGPGSLPEGVRLATHCMGQVPPSTYRARAGGAGDLRPPRQPGADPRAHAAGGRRARPQRATGGDEEDGRTRSRQPPTPRCAASATCRTSRHPTTSTGCC